MLAGDAELYEPLLWKPLEGSVAINDADQESRIQSTTLSMDGIHFDLKLMRIGGEYRVQLQCLPKRVDPHWSAKYELTYTAKIEGAQVNGTIKGEADAIANSELIVLHTTSEANPVDAQLTVSIRITDSTALHPPVGFDFMTRTKLSDAALKVEGQRVYITKAILAMQSPFFKRLFDEGSRDEEYTLLDITLEDLLTLLSCLYPNFTHHDIPLLNGQLKKDELEQVDRILSLACKFECPSVSSAIEKSLIRRIVPAHENLRLADKYQLSILTSKELQKLNTRKSYKDLQKNDSRVLSEELRSHLLEKVMDKMSTATGPQPQPIPVESLPVDAISRHQKRAQRRQDRMQQHLQQHQQQRLQQMVQHVPAPPLPFPSFHSMSQRSYFSHFPTMPPPPPPYNSPNPMPMPNQSAGTGPSTSSAVPTSGPQPLPSISQAPYIPSSSMQHYNLRNLNPLPMAPIQPMPPSVQSLQNIIAGSSSIPSGSSQPAKRVKLEEP